MAEAVVFTSGNGSNFQAICEAVAETEHKITAMICNKKDAYSFVRAAKLGIPAYHVSYLGRSRGETEAEIDALLTRLKPDLIVLAGFMKLLSPEMTEKYAGKIINIHPALLPKYPGTHGIEESFASPDKELGVTVHYVDAGMDTGKVIRQKSFFRTGEETIEEIEEKIHACEYEIYPQTVIELLNRAELGFGLRSSGACGCMEVFRDFGERFAFCRTRKCRNG